MKEPCLICGEGFLTELHSLTLCEYRGFEKELDTIYSICDSCKSEQADARQTKYNKQNFIEWQQEVDMLIKKWTNCVDNLDQLTKEECRYYTAIPSEYGGWQVTNRYDPFVANLYRGI